MANPKTARPNSLLFSPKTPINYVMSQSVADRLRAEGRVRVFLNVEDAQGRDIYSVYKEFGLRKEDIVLRWRANLGCFDFRPGANGDRPSLPPWIPGAKAWLRLGEFIVRSDA